MRRFLHSTEFWSTIGALLTLFALTFMKVPVLWVTILLSILVDSYAIGRTLWKRNRGQFYSGLLCSEFYLIMGLHVWAVLACRRWGLSPLHAGIALAVNQSIYNILRGIVKGIGTKTQMIFG